MLTYAYLCLLMLDNICLPMFTHVYIWLLVFLFFTTVYQCLPINSHIYSCLTILTRVFLCLPIFSHFHLCLPLFSCAFLPMLPHLYCLHTFTHVYSLSPMFTRVCTSLHMFALGTYASNYLLVINCSFVLDNLFLPMFSRLYLWLRLFTYVYLCLPLFTRVYLCLSIFSHIHLCSLLFTCVYHFTRVYLFCAW